MSDDTKDFSFFYISTDCPHVMRDGGVLVSINKVLLMIRGNGDNSTEDLCKKVDRWAMTATIGSCYLLHDSIVVCQGSKNDRARIN